MVGYQLIPVQPGFSVFTPTFTGVGAQVLDVATIDVCDATGAIDDPYGDVGIQKMDSEGAYLGSISYCYEAGGWDNSEPYTFRSGEAVCVNNATGRTVYFKVSGEVDLINKNMFGAGFSFWGNSTPVKISISEVDVVDENGDIFDPYGDVGIQKVDDEGAYLSSISYCYEAGGWDGELDLEPGEAVCVNNATGLTLYFKLPCPVTK